MNTLELDSELNALIVEGKNTDAFLRFYDENVIAQENDEPERHGREQWMRAREEMSKNLVKYHARVLANAANGDVSFSE
jgi:ketosteroid isomerase-like protein